MPNPQLEPGALQPVQARDAPDAGVNGVQRPAGGEIDRPVRCYRRAGCRPGGDETEPPPPVIGVDEVQVALVIGGVEAPVPHGWRGLDIASYFVPPELLAGAGVQGVDDVAGRGDVGDAAVHQGRRRNGEVRLELPHHCAGCPVERQHPVIGLPQVHQIAGGIAGAGCAIAGDVGGGCASAGRVSDGGISAGDVGDGQGVVHGAGGVHGPADGAGVRIQGHYFEMAAGIDQAGGGQGRRPGGRAQILGPAEATRRQPGYIRRIPVYGRAVAEH